MKTIVYATDDFCWKELMNNEVIRKYFISDALDIPIEIISSVRLMNTFLWKRHKRQKQGIVDVLVELNDDTKIDIELQVAQYLYWDRRCLFYLAKMYTENLRAGEEYWKLKKCVCISVLDFNLTEDDDYNKVYQLRDKKGRLFSDMLEVRVIELHKKLKEDEKLNDWIHLLNAKSEEDLNMINTKNPGVLEAIKEIKVMSLSKRMRLRHEAHLKEIRDKKAREDYVRLEGERIGIEKGIEKESVNTERERQRANAAEKESMQLREELMNLKEEFQKLQEKNK